MINYHVSADRCADEKFDGVATGLQIVPNAMRYKILMEHRGAGGVAARARGAGAYAMSPRTAVAAKSM